MKDLSSSKAPLTPSPRFSGPSPPSKSVVFPSVGDGLLERGRETDQGFFLSLENALARLDCGAQEARSTS